MLDLVGQQVLHSMSEDVLGDPELENYQQQLIEKDPEGRGVCK